MAITDTHRQEPLQGPTRQFLLQQRLGLQQESLALLLLFLQEQHGRLLNYRDLICDRHRIIFRRRQFQHSYLRCLRGVEMEVGAGEVVLIHHLRNTIPRRLCP